MSQVRYVNMPDYI